MSVIPALNPYPSVEVKSADAAEPEGLSPPASPDAPALGTYRCYSGRRPYLSVSMGRMGRPAGAGQQVCGGQRFTCIV